MTQSSLLSPGSNSFYTPGQGGAMIYGDTAQPLHFYA